MWNIAFQTLRSEKSLLDVKIVLSSKLIFYKEKNMYLDKQRFSVNI